MCKTLSDRILHARQHSGLTQKELARRVGISLTTVYNLESGKAKYSRCMVTIATVCGVEPAWLETGRGEMLLSAHDKILPVSGCRDISPVTAKIPMLSWNTINTLHSWNDHEQIKFLCSELLPILPKTKGQHYGLQVPDDSMEPEFSEGEVIVVDTQLAITNNQYLLARLEGESHITFKQLVVIEDRQYLRPLNPRYPIVSVVGKLQVFGVVVCKYKEYLYFGQ
ncbi:MAG: LexA family transcriptional regulator [Magnetococcales bacterium]|nr:LexA family transcriptional regulator [Magnetococcales bacterium]